MKTIHIYLICFVLFLSACEESDNGGTINFDQQGMLTHLADNVTIPAYTDFQTQTASMQQAVQAFAANPDLDNLQAAKSSMQTAWNTWQYVAYFDFGPALEAKLQDNLNIFPADTVQIKENMQSGSYDLNAASNVDAKGFPALDYLLFGVADTEQGVVDFYADAQAGSTRTQYLQALSAQINTLTTQVVEGWDAYRDTFVNSLGTEVGSATGLLVNALNEQYDQGIKNAKIGIPAGKKSLGSTLPQNVEAYYSGLSLELALSGLQAFKEIFTGTTYKVRNNNAGPGLDDYLDALGAKYNEEPLSTAIINQLDQGIEATRQVPAPLSAAVATHQEAVDQAYLEIQRLVALIKVDMTSALGILITSQDNDGD